MIDPDNPMCDECWTCLHRGDKERCLYPEIFPADGSSMSFAQQIIGSMCEGWEDNGE